MNIGYDDFEKNLAVTFRNHTKFKVNPNVHFAAPGGNPLVVKFPAVGPNSSEYNGGNKLADVQVRALFSHDNKSARLHCTLNIFIHKHDGNPGRTIQIDKSHSEYDSRYCKLSRSHGKLHEE